jgi:hypothetical protein
MVLLHKTPLPFHPASHDVQFSALILRPNQCLPDKSTKILAVAMIPGCFRLTDKLREGNRTPTQEDVQARRHHSKDVKLPNIFRSWWTEG